MASNFEFFDSDDDLPVTNDLLKAPKTPKTPKTLKTPKSKSQTPVRKSVRFANKQKKAYNEDSDSDSDSEDGENPDDEEYVEEKKETTDVDMDPSGIHFEFADAWTVDEKGKRNRLRIEGGRAALPKRVEAVCDDDDVMLVYMKNMGYSDAQVADAFQREGRTCYSALSINGRYLRILKAQEKERDEQLERELSEWTAEHDELLCKAYEMVQVEIDRTIERVLNRRFKMVADQIRKLAPTSRYSMKACADRYIGLMDGTAYIPIEIDDDPEARRAERDARVKAREEERAKALAAEAEEKRVKEEAEAKRKAEKIRKEETAHERKADRLRKAALAAQNNAAERMAALAAHSARVRAKLGRTTSKQVAADDSDLEEHTAADPRSKLTVEQLKQLCKQKALGTTGTKALLLAQLRTNDERCTVSVLRDRCREVKRKTTGVKEALLYRVAEHDTRQFLDSAGRRIRTKLTAAQRAQKREDEEIEKMYKELAIKGDTQMVDPET